MRWTRRHGSTGSVETADVGDVRPVDDQVALIEEDKDLNGLFTIEGVVVV